MFLHSPIDKIRQDLFCQPIVPPGVKNNKLSTINYQPSIINYQLPSPHNNARDAPARSMITDFTIAIIPKNASNLRFLLHMCEKCSNFARQNCVNI